MTQRPLADIVSFTGTQDGMTSPQRWRVISLLAETNAREFHHGDCVGADEEASGLAKAEHYKVHVHPASDVAPRKRAHSYADHVHEAKPALKRNTDLATVCTVLIATPKEYEEVVRSGTWSTIRRAKKLKREIYIVFPDGSYSHHNARPL